MGHPVSDYGYSEDEEELEEKCSPSSLAPSSCITPLPASIPLLPSPSSNHKLEPNNNNSNSNSGVNNVDSTTNIITKIKTEVT